MYLYQNDELTDERSSVLGGRSLRLAGSGSDLV